MLPFKFFQLTTEYTEFHGVFFFFFAIVIQTTEGRKDLGNTKVDERVDVHEILHYTSFRSG
jgi:hypothetical protein